MPLIQITARESHHPRECATDDNAAQAIVADLAIALPGLFVAHAEQLRLSKGMPEEGVQVTHVKFHPRSVNIPDVWLLIQFGESALRKKQRRKVRREIDRLIKQWFKENHLVPIKNIAVDCLWGPSHGFIRMNETLIEW